MNFDRLIRIPIIGYYFVFFEIIYTMCSNYDYVQDAFLHFLH